ncbi:MAG: hypothetical protein RLZZ297_1819, partial [Chloroflexota bacterium]
MNHRRALRMVWTAICLLPLLVACSGASALEPTAVAVPTETAVPATATPLPKPTETLVPTAVPLTEGGAPIKLDTMQFGVVNHLYYTDRERVLALTNIAGFDWVRQQIVWKDIEGPAGNYLWDQLDNIVEDTNAHNLKLLISIVQAPDFYSETN